MFRNHIKFLNMVEINFPSKFTVLTMQSICYFLPISTFVDDYFVDFPKPVSFHDRNHNLIRHII